MTDHPNGDFVTRREFQQQTAAHSQDHRYLADAVKATQEEVERRFNFADHIKEQMTRERTEYLPTAVFERQHEKLVDRLTQIERAITNLPTPGGESTESIIDRKVAATVATAVAAAAKANGNSGKGGFGLWTLVMVIIIVFLIGRLSPMVF